MSRSLFRRLALAAVALFTVVHTSAAQTVAPPLADLLGGEVAMPLVVEESGIPFTTALGFEALLSNNGDANTGVGAFALRANTFGGLNAALGYGALISNTTGWYNTATGNGALIANVTGYGNVGVGHLALRSNSTGHYNVAIGTDAGFNATTGSSNIYLGAGTLGAATDDHVIRIGVDQVATFVAGIHGAPVSGAGKVVFVDATGQLGTTHGGSTPWALADEALARQLRDQQADIVAMRQRVADQQAIIDALLVRLERLEAGKGSKNK